MNIVFLGTPDFAVATLDMLVRHSMNVVAVVSAPDKAAGRGMKLQESAVKKYAHANQIPVLQPANLKDPEFLSQLRSYNADIQVVVAFRMLPEAVWKMPPSGTINLHASLLPQYRGAAPINWVLINGEKKTGVTTFKLQHQIDTGNILLQEEVDIEANENAGSLHDKLMQRGAALMLKTLQLISENKIEEKPQKVDAELKKAPKIFTETCKINWDQTSREIDNLIRGLSPYPAAFTFLNQKKIKIFEAEKIYETHQSTPGTISSDNKTFLKYACNDGFISVRTLQMEGKNKMSIADFLRGNKV